MLASGEIQWQTPACEVGDDHWLPIVQQPHFGPPRKTHDSSVRATPPPISRKVESNPQPTQSRERSVHSGSGSSPALINLFAGLVTTDIVMTVMTFVLFIVGLNIEPVNEFAVNNGPSPADGLLCIGAVVLLPTMIVAWVGMFRFANWGRWTFLGVVCAGHLFSLGTSLFDFSAQWHFLDAFGSIESTLGGLLLGTAKELSALFDRFVLRKSVSPIRTREGRHRLLWGDAKSLAADCRIPTVTLCKAISAAATLPWSEESREAFETVLRELGKEGVQPGDRRQVKTIRVVQAYAFLSGSDSVKPEHLEIASHCLWDDPVGHPKVTAEVIARVANPPGMRVNQMLLEAAPPGTISGPDERFRRACERSGVADHFRDGLMGIATWWRPARGMRAALVARSRCLRHCRLPCCGL